MDECRSLLADASSSRQQDTFSQQVEFGPAKHLAFDEFQPVDIAFDWTGAPVDRKAGVYSQPIAAKIPAEAAQLGWTGALDIGYPLFELRATSFADQEHEALRQSPTRG